MFTEIVWLVGEGRHPSPEVGGGPSRGRHPEVGSGTSRGRHPSPEVGGGMCRGRLPSPEVGGGTSRGSRQVGGGWRRYWTKKRKEKVQRGHRNIENAVVILIHYNCLLHLFLLIYQPYPLHFVCALV